MVKSEQEGHTELVTLYARFTVLETTKQNNILDIVITIFVLRIIGLEVKNMISNHDMIYLAPQVHDPNTKSQHKNDIIIICARAAFELMKEKLDNLDYEVLMRNNNALECYVPLKENIATATEHHIQTKRMRPSRNSLWFTKELKHLINNRHQ
ncbi:hypothetical protein FHG87_007833 [Trinorchestia longiramus]|nr:hypothetical protein FHG87_007833 [Trinorchestia longiramus]